MIEIELPNTPVAWAASRVSPRGHYNPRGAEKNFTRWQVKSKYREAPVEGYVALQFEFFCPIPNSASKAKREKMLAGEIVPTSSDCSNMQKFYEDCIKGIVITDDRNVAFISSKKLYAEKGKILIRVFRLKEYESLYGRSF